MGVGRGGEGWLVAMLGVGDDVGYRYVWHHFVLIDMTSEGWLSHSLSLDIVHSRRNPFHFREDDLYCGKLSKR